MSAKTLPLPPWSVIQVACAVALFPITSVMAQDAAPSAKELAAQLAANVTDGASFVRLKLEVNPAGGSKSTMQVQIKARRTPQGSDVLYQILFPKERKGESVLLQKSSRGTSGKVLVPGKTVQNLSAGQMKEPLFGSDLAYEDVIDNFFSWPQQTLVGTEVLDRVTCQILESKPGGSSSYGKVRSWIDTKRMVPLRVEKYASSGQLVRRIETTRVAKDDKDRPVPASLTVKREGNGSVSEFDGTSSRHDVIYTDADFTVEGAQVLSAPKSAP